MERKWARNLSTACSFSFPGYHLNVTLLPRQARGKFIPSGIMNKKLGFRNKPNKPHKKNLTRTLSTNILLKFKHEEPRKNFLVLLSSHSRSLFYFSRLSPTGIGSKIDK